MLVQRQYMRNASFIRMLDDINGYNTYLNSLSEFKFYIRFNARITLESNFLTETEYDHYTIVMVHLDEVKEHNFIVMSYDDYLVYLSTANTILENLKDEIRSEISNILKKKDINK